MVLENIYLKPASVEEALQMACNHSTYFKYIAGGTDVLVNKYQGNVEAACLIDLSGIEELRNVYESDQHIRIGSQVKLDALKNYPGISDKFPALIEAAQAVGTPVIRKTATIGGNILCENRCTYYNQSEWWREAVGLCLKCDGDVCIATGGTKKCFSRFVSDTAPLLISLDAVVEITDADGTYICPLESIYSGDGINPFNLGKTAIIAFIQLPAHINYNCSFKKLRPRQSVDFTSLTTAVSVNENGKIKIVIGGGDPQPVVVEGTTGNAKDLISQAIKKPRMIDNDVYTRKYRKEMIGVFLSHSFRELNLSMG